MKIVIHAEGIVEDIASGQPGNEALKDLLAFIEATSKSSDQHSIYIVVTDQHPEAVTVIRSSLKGSIPSHRIQTCVLPKNVADVDKRAWHKRFIDSHKADLVLNKDSLKSYSEDQAPQPALSFDQKQKLAFVSPMPPTKTGIANYSAELVEELGKYYEIDLIVEDEQAQTCVFHNSLPVKAASFFRENASEYDFVIYHIGNSRFHDYQIPLIRRIPGVVVLHDFYLGDYQYYRFGQSDHLPLFTRSMYYSDGYKGALKSLTQKPSETINECPANYEAIRYATRIIVHSEYSKNLLLNHYQQIDKESIAVIPHLRDSTVSLSKETAREKLGISQNAFLACSFGVITENKLHEEILEAWSQSDLSSDTNTYLAFVGEDDSEYGRSVRSKMKSLDKTGNFSITGWTDNATFNTYLAACDIAIQLRKNSRGETSGTVLDAMNNSVATIINANGTMAEIPEGSTYRLNDDFSSGDLVNALNELYSNADQRKALAHAGRSTILNHYSPESCGSAYKRVIDRCYQAHLYSPIESARQLIPGKNEDQVKSIVRAVARSFGGYGLRKTLFLDVTATSKTDLRTGIERTTISLAREMILSETLNVRIEPVYLDCVDGEWTYRYARAFTGSILNMPGTFMDDAPFEPSPGDCILGLDHSGVNLTMAAKDGLFDRLKAQGVSLSFLVHDILPVTNPGVFPPGANTNFEDWLNVLCSTCITLIGVTDHVTNEIRRFMDRKDYPESNRPSFSFSHHGADFTRDEKPVSPASLSISKGGPKLLMVGTVEPRKRYDLALDVFEEMWSRGSESILIIVGKEGWTGLPDSDRRNIPDLVERFRNHPELNNRFFWYDNADDATLSAIYDTSDALLAMSEDEGFGLPLIEGAQKGLPIIARNIPVFREVAGENACFIDGYYPMGQKDKSIISDIADQLADWEKAYGESSHPTSENLAWKSWKESAHYLANTLLEKESSSQ